MENLLKYLFDDQVFKVVNSRNIEVSGKYEI